MPAMCLTDSTGTSKMWDSAEQQLITIATPANAKYVLIKVTFADHDSTISAQNDGVYKVTVSKTNSRVRLANSNSDNAQYADASSEGALVLTDTINIASGALSDDNVTFYISVDGGNNSQKDHSEMITDTLTLTVAYYGANA